MPTRAISDDEFEAQVLASGKPVLVDFWAEWCGPCKQIGPALEELSDELADKLDIVKINIDDNPEVASRFAVRSIPTLMLFQGGEVASTRGGAMAKSRIAEWLNDAI